MTSAPTVDFTNYRELLATAILVAKVRLSPMTSRFFDRTPIGPMETATVLERYPHLTMPLIRIANTVQYGAGIPVTSLSAAAVRLGPDRMQTIAMAYELTRALAEVMRPAGVDVGEFCHKGLLRASLGRAMAMMQDRNIAGAAFLVGYLQDVGRPLIAAAFPEEYRRLSDESEGCPLRFAAMKYHALGMNHIHAGVELLEGARFSKLVIDAIGRHHTNAPTTRATDASLMLWQIGYVTGLVPVGAMADEAGALSMARRYLPSMPEGAGDPLARVMRAAGEEYADVAELFGEFIGERAGRGQLLGGMERRHESETVSTIDRLKSGLFAHESANVY
ncbi:MAG: HDOD domain-containing protein [Planctomycetes bacterium]|nr:HDOD domain-containing protein [Planctomycetota bacterium]